MPTWKQEQGFALVTVLLLVGLITALLAAYFFLTGVEMLTTRSTMSSNRGFYAAEAGINVRAEAIRQEFLGYRRPSGTPPTPAPGGMACRGGDPGDGDFGCATLRFRGRDVLTHIDEDASNPSWITIPPGERFQNLNAQIYGYDIHAVTLNRHDEVEALLDMHLLTRLVPLFQFAVFYDKDLEILPGPPMLLEGPVHTNGDLYLSSGSGLTIEGQVTTGGALYNGRKNKDTCGGGGVAVYDPAAPLALPDCAVRTEITAAEAARWNGMIRVGVDEVTVPEPEVIDAEPGRLYWDRADLRIMLDLDGAGVQLRDASDAVDVTGTAFLTSGCGGALAPVGSSSAMRNFREDTTLELLEIDVDDLLDCVALDPGLLGGKTLDDGTDGGLVFYFGVDGPAAGGVNNYGVRIRDGARLASTLGGPPIRGLTVVTDQAIYVLGDYNSDPDWRPAAFLADSLNVLSNAWDDSRSAANLDERVAADTTVMAAFLAGTDTTGGFESEAGQDLGRYNGGVENYPRFHEKWTGSTLTYRGSFVSLGRPRHVAGLWEDQSYVPPHRDWRYELRFNDAANLPPLTPRFVYLKQDGFGRRYDGVAP